MKKLSIRYWWNLIYENLYTKDPYEAKYQLIAIKHKSVGLKYCNDLDDFIEHFNSMSCIYENINKNNLVKRPKILVMSDDMFTNITGNKKLIQ